MKINSRFAKTTVAAAIVLSTGAAALGITSFVSAEIQDPAVNSAPAPHAKRTSPLSVAATALGMTEADLMTELKDGKSIADVASAKGVEVDTVIDALYADMKAHIDAHVSEGKLTQEQADARLADAKTRISTMVTRAGLPTPKGPRGLMGPNGTHGQKGMGGNKGDYKGGHMGHRGAPKFATEELAKVLGLSAEELNTEMKAGKTLTQIADEKNVSIDKVKDQLLKDFTARVNEKVADGKHTQEEVDAKIEEFSSRLDDIVNGVRPMRPMDGRMGGHMGGHNGGRGQHGRGMGGHDSNHAGI